MNVSSRAHAKAKRSTRAVSSANANSGSPWPLGSATNTAYAIPVADPTMARCQVRVSIVTALTVSSPADPRAPAGTNPVRKLSGMSAGRRMNLVQPLRIARWIRLMPPMSANATPAVADVYASGRAFAHPPASSTLPTAAAVPCPPAHPVGRRIANPGGRCGKSGARTSRPNNMATGYCPTSHATL